MDRLEVFKNEQFGEIRTVEVDGKPYFVASDIAKALGYSNTSKAVSDHCRWVTKCYIPHPQSKTKTIEVNVVPEGDLYRLISNSVLPNAQKFEMWVFDEVLPSIRKHGMYAVDELLENPDLLIKVATELKEERQRRQIAEEGREQLRQELDYSKDWYSIKRVAAMNGVNWKSFDWRRLKRKSIQLGYGVKKIFDANYGEVNTYHREAWEAAYPQYEI